MSTKEDKSQNAYFISTPTPTAFLNVIEPRKVGKKGKERGEPVFAIELLLDPAGEDYKNIGAILRRIAAENWPGRNLKELAFPIRKGDELIAAAGEGDGKDKSFYKGKIVLKAKSGAEYPPALFIPGQKDPLKDSQRTMQGREYFYNGAVVIASLFFKPYNGSADGGIGEKSGVKAYLQGVGYRAEGKRIGGNGQAEQFAAYMGTVSQEDPTGGDDEIPF